jgi:hypothetical protein
VEDQAGRENEKINTNFENQPNSHRRRVEGKSHEVDAGHDQYEEQEVVFTPLRKRAERRLEGKARVNRASI